MLIEACNKIGIKKLLPLVRPPRRHRHRAAISKLRFPRLRQQLQAINKIGAFKTAPHRGAFELGAKVPVTSGLIKDETRQLVLVHPVCVVWCLIKDETRQLVLVHPVASIF
jgi:hypothetical protein